MAHLSFSFSMVQHKHVLKIALYQKSNFHIADGGAGQHCYIRGQASGH